MAKRGALLFSYAFSILVFATSLSCKAIDSEDRKTYIVYLGREQVPQWWLPPSPCLTLRFETPRGFSPPNMSRSACRSVLRGRNFHRSTESKNEDKVYYATSTTVQPEVVGLYSEYLLFKRELPNAKAMTESPTSIY
ncbi:hypothetical protein GBA52_008982 [Prunus armeniaca]|nr:hypothetical protein GBA52_008982 [Prunus armeniaca]